MKKVPALLMAVGLTASTLIAGQPAFAAVAPSLESQAPCKVILIQGGELPFAPAYTDLGCDPYGDGVLNMKPATAMPHSEFGIPVTVSQIWFETVKEVYKIKMSYSFINSDGAQVNCTIERDLDPIHPPWYSDLACSLKPSMSLGKKVVRSVI